MCCWNERKASKYRGILNCRNVLFYTLVWARRVKIFTRISTLSFFHSTCCFDKLYLTYLDYKAPSFLLVREAMDHFSRRRLGTLSSNLESCTVHDDKILFVLAYLGANAYLSLLAFLLLKCSMSKRIFQSSMDHCVF